MKTVFLGFQRSADAAIKDYSKRGRITGAAVALAVASKLPLPTSPVSDLADHYQQQLAQSAARLVGEFNEALVFDARACLEHVRQHWMVRYTAAHPACHFGFVQSHNFFDSLFGVDRYIDAQHHELCDEQKSAVLGLASIACTIIEELTQNG